MPDSGLSTTWEFSSGPVAGPGVASIVVPAGGSGVSRVLSRLTANLVSNATIAIAPFLQVFNGGTLVFQWQMLLITTAGVGASVDFDRNIVVPSDPATALTVNFSGGVAGLTEQLAITGYDL
jgi:hypothetical protein